MVSFCIVMLVFRGVKCKPSKCLVKWGIFEPFCSWTTGHDSIYTLNCHWKMVEGLDGKKKGPPIDQDFHHGKDTSIGFAKSEVTSIEKTLKCNMEPEK